MVDRRKHKPRGSFDFRLYWTIWWLELAVAHAENIAFEMHPGVEDEPDWVTPPDAVHFIEIEQIHLAIALGVKSVRTVQHSLDRLVDQGWLDRFRLHHRAICGYRTCAISPDDHRVSFAVSIDYFTWRQTHYLGNHAYVSFYDTKRRIQFARQKIKVRGTLITCIPA